MPLPRLLPPRCSVDTRLRASASSSSGKPLTSRFSPHIIGEVAQPRPTGSCRPPRWPTTSTLSFRPLIIGEVAQRSRALCSPASSPFSPLIIGEVAQRYVAHRPEGGHGPSVPSSSGRSLNGPRGTGLPGHDPSVPSSSGRLLNSCSSHHAPKMRNLQSLIIGEAAQPHPPPPRARPMAGHHQTIFSRLIIGEAAQPSSSPKSTSASPRRPSVPSSSGRPLNVPRSSPLSWRPPSLQSPHHRGGRSTCNSCCATKTSSTSLQSPHHRGGRSTPLRGRSTRPSSGRQAADQARSPSVPSSSGRPLNGRGDPQRTQQRLQSPHHRGGRSTKCRLCPMVETCPLQSPHHRGGRSTQIRRGTRHQRCFSPLIIGEVAQQHPSGSERRRGFRGHVEKGPERAHFAHPTFRVHRGSSASEISCVHAGF